MRKIQMMKEIEREGGERKRELESRKEKEAGKRWREKR